MIILVMLWMIASSCISVTIRAKVVAFKSLSLGDRRERRSVFITPGLNEGPGEGRQFSWIKLRYSLDFAEDD